MGAHIHTDKQGHAEVEKHKAKKKANCRRRETRRSRTTEGELSHTLGLRTVLSSPLPPLLAHRFFFLFLLLLLHLFILFLCRTLDQGTQPAPKVAISSSLSLFPSLPLTHDTPLRTPCSLLPYASCFAVLFLPTPAYPSACSLIRSFVRLLVRSLACLYLLTCLSFNPIEPRRRNNQVVAMKSNNRRINCSCNIVLRQVLFLSNVQRNTWTPVSSSSR